MTRYTVVWHDAAQNQIAEVWLDWGDRQAITQVAYAIDLELANDPDLKGSVASGVLRELVVPPVRILFAVSEADRLVKVVHLEPL